MAGIPPRDGARARVLAIVGPTATGKSEAAAAVARKLGGYEILSADSMQVYRGMDIGTAKPPKSVTDAAPHHLLSFIDPWEDFSVARFQSLARKTVSEIQSRGHLPLIVGGSGLYLRAIIDPLEFPTNEPNSKARQELEALEKRAPELLVARLLRVDPEAAKRVDLKNIRRVIRAIEAAEADTPQKQRHQKWRERESIYDALIVGLKISREELVRIIEKRVDKMVRDGLEAEVRKLLSEPRGFSSTAAQALGYREMIAYINGETTLDAAIETIKIKTRQFAKRQMTWFRADPRVHWVEMSQDDHQQAVKTVIDLVKESGFIVT